MAAAMKVLSGLLLTGAALVASGAATAAELETRTSSAAGVTIKVTPKNVAPDAAAQHLADRLVAGPGIAFAPD